MRPDRSYRDFGRTQLQHNMTLGRDREDCHPQYLLKRGGQVDFQNAEPINIPANTIDHGQLQGLADDDHPQYLLVGATAGGELAGTYPNPTVAATHSGSAHHARSHAVTSTSDHTAGNWKVFYSNGSGQLIELPLSYVGCVLQSNGATSAPTFAFLNEDHFDSTAQILVRDITCVIDGGGSAITTGIKLDLCVDFDCMLTGWTLLADQTGSIVVDIWKDTYANYPPTIAEEIIGSGGKPTISSDTKGQDTDIDNWDHPLITAGDTLRFNVDSCTSITRCTLALKARVT